MAEEDTQRPLCRDRTDRVQQQLILHPLARHRPYTERLSQEDLSRIWSFLLATFNRQKEQQECSKKSNRRQEKRYAATTLWWLRWMRDTLPEEGIRMLLALLSPHQTSVQEEEELLLESARGFNGKRKRDPVKEALSMDPVLRVLVSYLDAESVARASCVCKQWRNICSDDTELWERLCKKRFGIAPEEIVVNRRRSGQTHPKDLFSTMQKGWHEIAQETLLMQRIQSASSAFRLPVHVAANIFDRLNPGIFS
eukprot:gb/GECG01002168.1/.p1 GENE.gb/GECG01002168.1/~~gb/GECG01002168.1/.p1  ORF type:complete len:253 (+),score=33.54 gb/GECG01002168.1/:1-759(+)